MLRQETTSDSLLANAPGFGSDAASAEPGQPVAKFCDECPGQSWAVRKSPDILSNCGPASDLVQGRDGVFVTQL